MLLFLMIRDWFATCLRCHGNLRVMQLIDCNKYITQRLALLITLIVMLAPPVMADGNRIFLLQSSPANGAGNSVFVDQSRAIDSLVRGGFVDALPTTTPLSPTPAIQHGTRNTAAITLHGTGSEMRLSQHGLPRSGVLAPVFDNSAIAVLRGNQQRATLSQVGSGNSGEIQLRRGDGAAGTLNQLGNNNTGLIRVRGSNTNATLIQNGSNLESALVVRARGASVTYQVNGSNLSTHQGVTVTTNIGSAGPIAITQTR